MAATDPWRPAPELYRPLLILQVRKLLYRESRLRRRFDSSDVVQDTLAEACKKIHEFRGTTEAELVDWLHTILERTIITLIRRHNAQKRDIGLEQSIHAAIAESSVCVQEFIVANDPSPSDEAKRKELLLRVTAAVDQLPANQREVVTQRDLLGATVKEIAASLGRTERSVAGLLRRGHRELRKMLKDLQE